MQGSKEFCTSTGVCNACNIYRKATPQGQIIEKAV
jgi:hypothetical protein